jgi:hypothetical protein
MSQRGLLVSLIVLVLLSAGFVFVYTQSKSSQSNVSVTPLNHTATASLTTTPTPGQFNLVKVLCAPGKNGGPNICPEGYTCDNNPIKRICNSKGVCKIQAPGICVLHSTPNATNSSH